MKGEEGCLTPLPKGRLVSSPPLFSPWLAALKIFAPSPLLNDTHF